MRQFVITLVALLSFVPETRAQSFMQHLQQEVKGKGTVTVTQSKDIDELVDTVEHRPLKKISVVYNRTSF